ncbi:MAG: hypothetical protein WD154_06805 [Nitrosopumilaceae archaeon]
MLTEGQIRASILFKLHKRGNWGASHTAFDNIKKGFNERDLGKHGTKIVDKIAKELIREGLIITKPTHYGMQISLNPRQNEKIITIMKMYFPEV